MKEDMKFLCGNTVLWIGSFCVVCCGAHHENALNKYAEAVVVDKLSIQIDESITGKDPFDFEKKSDSYPGAEVPWAGEIHNSVVVPESIKEIDPPLTSRNWDNSWQVLSQKILEKGKLLAPGDVALEKCLSVLYASQESETVRIPVAAYRVQVNQGSRWAIATQRAYKNNRKNSDKALSIFGHIDIWMCDARGEKVNWFDGCD